MKILILGVGNPQADLIQYLSANHEVHAVSYSSEGEGIQYADAFKVIDIRDVQSVYAYAKQHHIEVVYSIGSDLGMVTAAIVSDRLGLPTFITPGIAKICHNKDLMRSRFPGKHWNIHYKVLHSTTDINGTLYPLIIKPADSQGQRGVFLIRDKNEFVEKFPVSLAYSKAKCLVAEEYIDGPEVSVHAYIIAKEIKFLLISDRIVWPEYPGGIIHKHRIPTQFVNKESKSRVRKLVEEVIKEIGIEDGPVYFQIKLKHDEPKLIEVTPRLDGCHMWRLIKYAYGIDLMEITMQHLLNGEVLHGLKPDLLRDTWILEFMCDRPGREMDPGKYNIEHSKYHEWYYDEGEKIRPTNTYMEKCGYQIYHL